MSIQFFGNSSRNVGRPNTRRRVLAPCIVASIVEHCCHPRHPKFVQKIIAYTVDCLHVRTTFASSAIDSREDSVWIGLQKTLIVGLLFGLSARVAV